MKTKPTEYGSSAYLGSEGILKVIAAFYCGSMALRWICTLEARGTDLAVFRYQGGGMTPTEAIADALAAVNEARKRGEIP